MAQVWTPVNNLIVLDNIPPSYDEELMTEYVEGTLSVDVKTVKIIGRMALFCLEQNIQDFENALNVVKRESREGKKMKLMAVDKRDENSVVIYDIDRTTLDESILKTYIEGHFNKGKDSTLCCKIWPMYNMGIVHFKAPCARVVEKLLAKKKHILFQSTVVIEPFYYNFHDIIEKKLPTTGSKSSTLKKVMVQPREVNSGESESCSELESEVEDDQSEIETHSEQELEFGDGQNGSETHSEQESEVEDDQSESESCSHSEEDENPNELKQQTDNGTDQEEDTYLTADSDSNTSFSESSSDCEDQWSRKQGGNIQDLSKGTKTENFADFEVAGAKFAKEPETDRNCSNNDIKKFENVQFSEDVLQAKKELTMTEVQYLLMNDHFGTFKKCSAQFKRGENKAVIEGEITQVEEHLRNILLVLKEITTRKLELSGCLPQILSKEKAQTFLNNLKEMKDVVFHKENNQLLLASKCILSLTAAFEKLEGILNYKENTKSDFMIPLEELNSLKEKLENQLLVEMTWNKSQDEIYIEGVKDDVLLSKKDIDQLVFKFGEVSKTFTVKGNVADYIKRLPSQKIEQIFQGVKMKYPKECKKESSLSYTYQGKGDILSKVENSLKSLEENIITQKINFKEECFSPADIRLITLAFKNPKMKKKLKAFENKNVFVKINLPSESCFKYKTKRIPQLKPAIYPINISSQIILKKGDIISQNSDILVCVMDKSINLRKTNIGQAFNKACPQLNDKLRALKSEYPEANILTVNGPFPPPFASCLAIIGIILHSWEATSSVTELKGLMASVLDVAVTLGAKSVSFPTLGHGRVFKFPSQVVSQVMIESLELHLTSNPALKEIIIMTYDQEMYDTFKLQAEKSLHYASKCFIDDSIGSDKEEDDMDKEIVLDLEEFGEIEISITMKKSDNPDATLKKLIRLIKTKCLYCVEVKNALLSFIYPSIQNFASKFNSLDLQRTTVLNSNETKLTIKGFNKDVKKVENFIQGELKEMTSKLKDKTIATSNAPQRGTIEFLRHASKIIEMCPSYWEFCKGFSLMHRLFGKKHSRQNQHNQEIVVKVDSKTKKAITDLFEKTWDSTLCGEGRDAKGLVRQTTVEVLNVERVENPSLFEPYALSRKVLFEKYAKLDKICDDFSKTLPRGQIKTTEILKDFMKQELYPEVNEHYLFHGTKRELIDNLTHRGADPKLCTNAMLGNGVYVAEMSTKSDQYADSKQHRTEPGEELKILLMRVLLGNPYIINRDHPSLKSDSGTPRQPRLKRPPCASCEHEGCPNPDHVYYDSVTLDSSTDDERILFREFVVYDISLCYPEYIITYRRVAPANENNEA